MVIVNYLSNTGIFGGNTMKTVSDTYFTHFTPAGYAFSIWGIIYLGLLAFVLYTGLPLLSNRIAKPVIGKIGWLFCISCLANMLWIVSWLSHYTLLSVGLMVVLLLTLLVLVKRLELNIVARKWKDYLFIALPFSLYTGWISVAIIANVASLLVKNGWEGFGLSAMQWTVMMIGVAGIVNLYMVLRRNMRAFGVVGIWALLAIAANQNSNGSTIIYACYAMSGILSIAILFNFFKSYKQKIS
ncbi:hypothetical protein GCM10017764_19100 [Sphingobacterium griseoflavum]|uniref:Tryptophan-rich sensory protein n=2 Tax=Sphingobacterium griseoflavum TaxID=1474952 RepID=A0ABQ3HZL6_9SPHI|nr:hypothetical protein GCM10017764_19100 [Sphingobacterium griseoflavum]